MQTNPEFNMSGMDLLRSWTCSLNKAARAVSEILIASVSPAAINLNTRARLKTTSTYLLAFKWQEGSVHSSTPRTCFVAGPSPPFHLL
jgi:hypothetical protein